MPTLLEKKASELDELHSLIIEIQEKAAGEDRSLTDLEKDRIAALSEAAGKLRGECEFLNEQVTSERAWSKLRQDIEANRPTEDNHPVRRPGMQMQPSATGALDVRGWGDQFIDSDAFKNYPGAGTSQRVAVPSMLDDGYQQRAAIGTGDVPLQQPYIWTPPTPATLTPLLQVVGKTTVSTNAVSWVQWAPNPMAPAPVVAEGALKTEATMTATAVSDTLDTYATYKEITRQALEDVPQIRQTVEARLRQSVMMAMEGIVVTALTAATIPPTTGVSGTSLLEAIRVGTAMVQAAGYNPNAVALNPADWAGIDIAIMAGTLNGAAVNGSLWGMRLVAVPALTQGTAYVGDFSTGVMLFSRSTTDVYLSDSHADNFLRNILVLLAEQRALATVPEPNALAECAAVP